MGSCGNICGMKYFVFGLLCVMCLIPNMAGAFVKRDVAVVRVLNKDAGKVQEINIPVGSETQLEKLFINVRTCQQTDPFQAEDFFAFIEIAESGKGQIYGNWMSRNEPGQNPLQHPDYDVWLVKCE